MAKKQLKIFEDYCDAIIYCFNNDIKFKKVEKHNSRTGTSKNWFVHLNNGKSLKA